MAVSKRLRYEILRRDNHACRYCGATAPDVKLTVDHVTPVALGGTDEPTNLVTSCEPCNSGKTSSTPDAALVADVSDDALRWAAAMEQAAEMLREQETPKLEYRDAFLAEWNRWHIGKDDTKKVPLDDNWKQSIERFRVAGIPAWMWSDIVDIGMANEKVKPENTFRYCCGIAWNKVAELQAEAKRLVGDAVDPKSTTALIQAAMDVWNREHHVQPDSEASTQFRLTIEELSKKEDDHRVLYAAQYAAWYSEADAAIALRDADREEALRQWDVAWRKAAGDFPSDTQVNYVHAQINALLTEGVYVGRVTAAAAYAGSRCTKYLHFGLSPTEQELLGTNDGFVRTLEIWAEAFRATAGRRPELREQNAFLKNMELVGQDGNLLVADVHHAAAAAGAYQDTDFTTCLTRNLSVFEAAAFLAGGEN